MIKNLKQEEKYLFAYKLFKNYNFFFKHIKTIISNLISKKNINIVTWFRKKKHQQNKIYKATNKKTIIV